MQPKRASCWWRQNGRRWKGWCAALAVGESPCFARCCPSGSCWSASGVAVGALNNAASNGGNTAATYPYDGVAGGPAAMTTGQTTIGTVATVGGGASSGGFPGGAGLIPAQGGMALPERTIDVDSETDSNHDTALTLACAGGHEELVELLINRGANIEHKDKKGFTPLILAATAGHEKVVDTLLRNGAELEAQSERTKDTPLSLACSGGRYEVVELLLSMNANREPRSVSYCRPLCLAASGGYVNIIKLFCCNTERRLTLVLAANWAFHR
uniref:Putative rtk signaling protein mask/unc-44 n=1 Tax=Anopheles darlingi TaxID=43151 RepID=A0A2M4DQL5_ANODA